MQVHGLPKLVRVGRLEPQNSSVCSICLEIIQLNIKLIFHMDLINNSEDQQKTKLIRKCMDHFAKIHEQRPRSVKPQLDFADFCIMIEEHSKAEEIYCRLVKLVDIHPENMQQIFLKAVLFQLYLKRSESNAIILFLKGLKIECDSYEWRKCHEQLERWADRKLNRNACDSKALSIKGFLHQLDGNKPEATEYFEKALEFDPINEEYLSALCELHLSTEDHNNA